jgi:peptide methionine sulfoxide reductase MsrA
MSKHYFNTNKLNGSELKKYENRCKSQDDEIEAFFKKYPEKMFTPSEIWKKLFTIHTPLTSIRRAITRVMNENKTIIKTDKQKIGLFGNKEHYYRYNDSQLNIFDYA